jgi:hypothetical protein
VGASGDPSRGVGDIVFTWANETFTEEEIGVVNADGSAQRHLTDSPGFDVSPA